MFVFSDSHSDDVKLEDSVHKEADKLLRVRHVLVDKDGRVRSNTVESEEFVVLWKFWVRLPPASLAETSTFTSYKCLIILMCVDLLYLLCGASNWLWSIW